MMLVDGSVAAGDVDESDVLVEQGVESIISTTSIGGGVLITETERPKLDSNLAVLEAATS